MRRSLVVVVLLSALGLLAVGGAGQMARAQDASLNRARDSFDKGQALFEQGKFAEAAAEFEAAYQARPFAQFLFNVGACHEKLRDYEKAARYYRRYVEAEPNAPDRKQTEKRIEVLEKAAAELQAGAASPQPATPDESGAGPQSAMAELDDPSTRGLLVIESEPQSASIYLDSKKTPPLSADAAFGVGSISLALAVYYTFRDKGAGSTGSSDVRALPANPGGKTPGPRVAWRPEVAPGFAGLGMEVRG